MAKCERYVLRAIKFRIAVVTPLHYMELFLQATGYCSNNCCTEYYPNLHTVFNVIMDLSRLSHELSFTLPSLVAAASLYLAKVTLGLKEENGMYWTKNLECTTGYSLQEIKRTVIDLYQCQLLACLDTENKRNKIKHRTIRKMIKPVSDILYACVINIHL